MGDVIMIKLKKEKIGIPIYFLNKESKINRSTEKINYFSFPVFFLKPRRSSNANNNKKRTQDNHNKKKDRHFFFGHKTQDTGFRLASYLPINIIYV
jgi:hypothetical protein